MLCLGVAGAVVLVAARAPVASLDGACRVAGEQLAWHYAQRKVRHPSRMLTV